MRVYSDESIEDKDQAIRDSLTAEQERAKGLNMADRNRISERFVSHVINKAESTGRPDILGFTLKPDKHGVILAYHPDFSEEISTGISNAQSAQLSMEKEARLKRERAEKKFAAEAGKAILDYAETDPNTALKLFAMTGDKMGFEMYKGIKKVFSNMRAVEQALKYSY